MIGHLLLRSGRLATVYFYGARGGSKTKKGSIVELGHMLKIKLVARKAFRSGMFTAKESNIIWDSSHIRLNYDAFNLMCFIFELVSKIGVEEDEQNRDTSDSYFSGLFGLVSNALFYLDKSLKEGDFQWEEHLELFLVKLIGEMGVVPQIYHCGFCRVNLDHHASLFRIEHADFVCLDCIGQRGESHQGDNRISEQVKLSKKIRDSLIQYAPLPYRDWKPSMQSSQLTTKELMTYFCHQFDFDPRQFRVQLLQN